MSNTFEQLNQQQAYNTMGYSQTFPNYGGGLGGYGQQLTYGFGPTIQIVPVPVQEPYDSKKAIQIVYRFNKGLVQACLIKGTLNVETAKNVFLGQFDGNEPEIVAAVEVALAG